MTAETEVVLPLMVATMAATVTARSFGMESIYLAGLKKKGVHVPEGIEETAPHDHACGVDHARRSHRDSKAHAV